MSLRIGSPLPPLPRASAAAAPAPTADKAKTAPGAKLQVLAGDKAQTLTVSKGYEKVCPTGEKGKIVIRGTAGGAQQYGDGLQNLWLGIFRFQNPKTGKLDHVGGLNVAVPTKPGQTAKETAKLIADRINSAKRPYEAKVTGTDPATITIVYREKVPAKK